MATKVEMILEFAKKSVRGVRCAVRGVRYAACGMRYAACGVRYAACGVRYAACGVRVSTRYAFSQLSEPGTKGKLTIYLRVKFPKKFFTFFLM